MLVTWIAVTAYLLVSGILMWRFCIDPDSMRQGLGFKCLTIVFGLGIAVVIFPVTTFFWWLYPERHVNECDVYGTDEQKRVWNEYRDRLAQKPFRRRLAEKLGLVPDLDLPWPDQDWPEWPYEEDTADKSHPTKESPS